MMKNLNNLVLGGYYQLSAEGYWFTPSRLIWVNNGKKIDDDRALKIYLFNPNMEPDAINSKVDQISQDETEYKLIDTGAHNFDNSIVFYAIFAQVRAQLQPNKQEFVQSKKAPKVQQEPDGPKRRTWPIITGIMVVGVIVCLSSTVVGMPIIRKILATPTYTSTSTATLTSTPTQTPIPSTLTPTPTHTKTPSHPTPEVVFSDDFTDQAKTIEQWDQVSGEWQITDGVYSCSAVETNCLSLATNISAPNYTIFLDTLGLEGVDKSIYFGVTEQKYFRISLLSNPLNQIIVSEISTETPERILSQFAFENANEIWYQMQIVFVGQTISIYIDDSLAFSMSEPSVQSFGGYVGLGVEPIDYDSSTLNTAQFDNFEIAINE